MFLVYGNDEFLIKKQVKKLVNKIKEDSPAVEVYDYSLLQDQWTSIMNEIATVGLFAEPKIVVINDCWFLADTRGKGPDTNVDEASLLTLLQSGAPDDVTVIFTVPTEKLNKKSKVYKAFETAAKLIAITRPDSAQIAIQVQKKLTSAGCTIDDDAMNYFLTHLPNEMQLVQNELNKLCSYDGHLTRDVVGSLLTKYYQYDIFKVVDALLKNDAATFIALWHEFCALNGDIYSFLALLSVNLIDARNVLYYKACMWPQSQVVESLKMNPYRVKILWSIKNINYEQINEKIKKMYLLNYNINGGLSGAPSIFELNLLHLIN